MKIMRTPVVVPPMGGIVPPWLADGDGDVPHIWGPAAGEDDWDERYPSIPDPRRGSDG